MPYSSQSSLVAINQKPTNVFYVWYSELCRRLNCNPSTSVKPARLRTPTALDFVSDRLRVQDWSPVISALKDDTSLHSIAIRSRIERDQFMHDIDNEHKVKKLKTKYGLVWTAYILKSLLKSLTYTVRHNPVLAYLELDGIPMFEQYLEPLLKALKQNRSLRSLSLIRCKIDDIGCKLVCAYLKTSPNIEVLDLSWCGLTVESGRHIAKLIQFQQINRSCENWHNSLRYGDPNQYPMRGIKRITLNGNRSIGDEGLDLMLKELIDDLWVKAIDMQKCGITESISMKILDVVEYNKVIEIADFRNNEHLHIATLQRLLDTLKKRQHPERSAEFQWCNSAVTLTGSSTIDTDSRSSTSTIHQTKSLPLKQRSSQILPAQLRKTKTSDDVTKKNPNYIKCDEIDKKIRELNLQLQEEIAKRKKAEKLNEELMKKNEQMNGRTIRRTDVEVNSLLTKIVHNNMKKKTNGMKDMFGKICENGYSTNGVTNQASSIFTSLVESAVSKEALETRRNGEYECGDDSSSQTSLYKFMESLKRNNN